jgi:uncharacterized protein YndB with AHSA1/START domain
MSNTFDLTLTRNIHAPRQAIYDAWLDAKALAQFMLPGEGMSVPKAESDPRVGGKFLVVMKAGDQELPHSGEYKTLVAPEKIAFTWVSPFSQEPSLVTIGLRAITENETELTLTHTGLPNEESRDNHHGGWSNIVEVLGRFLS